MGECDWLPYSFTFTAAPPLTLQAFGYVLVFSRRKFYRLFPSNDLHALMDGHVAAFERFQGAAHQCKYDSQKPVALRWEGTQPIHNPRFIAFATHYEFRPVGIRGNPNAKPRVGRSFWKPRSFSRNAAHATAQRRAARIVRGARLARSRSYLSSAASSRRQGAPQAPSVASLALMAGSAARRWRTTGNLHVEKARSDNLGRAREPTPAEFDAPFGSFTAHS